MSFRTRVSNVIEFDRARPNANMIRFDDDNRPMYLYSVDYKRDGRRIGFELWAYSVADAHQRIDEIKASAEYSGALYERQTA